MGITRCVWPCLNFVYDAVVVFQSPAPIREQELGAGVGEARDGRVDVQLARPRRRGARVGLYE